MSGHERIICPHGTIISTCRCMNAAEHTRVKPCPWPERHVGQPVTAGWVADGTRPTTDLKQREGDQHLPVVNDEPDVQSQVIADIEERRKVGISRYGTALQPFNGRDALRDLYEELLDGAMYAKQLVIERDRLLSAAEENQRLKLRIAHLEAEVGALNEELADWRTFS